MGKDEDKPVEEESSSGKETVQNNDEINQEGYQEAAPDSTQEKEEAKVEDHPDKKENDESIRKVIKFEPSQQDGENKEIAASADADTQASTRESLEQKRAILQSIKDFDFQIKKNQESIDLLNQRLDSVTKDLDDLVSLYEIVSEQMNPFVGLSKVTKKRIDALENFTREIDTLKMKMGDLESFAEQMGAKIEDYQDTDHSLEGNNPRMSNSFTKELSNGDLDNIIEGSLNVITADERIEMVMDEFIKKLQENNFD
jgi:flagellar protein FlaC